MKRKYREVNRKRRQEEWEKKEEEEGEDEDKGDERKKVKKQPEFYEIKDGAEFRAGKTYMKKRIKTSLGDRLKSDEANFIKVIGTRSNREMTFVVGKKKFSRPTFKHRRADEKDLSRRKYRKEETQNMK